MVRATSSNDVTQHAFVQQQIVNEFLFVLTIALINTRGDVQDGIPIANAVANVAFNKDNMVVSLGSSLITPGELLSSCRFGSAY